MTKRKALSNLTNSNHLPSSSVSSSTSIHPIKQNPLCKYQNNKSNNIRNLNPLLDVKPLTVRCKKNQNKALAVAPTTLLTPRCRKKQHVVSNEQIELEDFIEKQKVYYKEIDEFELEEEEVESVDELE